MMNARLPRMHSQWMLKAYSYMNALLIFQLINYNYKRYNYKRQILSNSTITPVYYFIFNIYLLGTWTIAFYVLPSGLVLLEEMIYSEIINST